MLQGAWNYILLAVYFWPVVAVDGLFRVSLQCLPGGRVMAQMHGHYRD